jgi:transglutaminase-like putative cysteine protease
LGGYVGGLVKGKRRKSKEPERSLTLRLLVLAAMLAAMLALARVRPSLWPHVIVSAMGIGVGHWYSYHTLDKSTVAVRGIMFLLLHVALAWLIVGLAIGATVPQAQFAIFAQAITSFDLRYRRSLFNTLFHSLANLYVAASLSRTFELALYLILFASLVLAAFFVAGKEDGLKSAKLRPKPKSIVQASSHRQSMTIFGFSFGVMVILATFVAFIFTPRFANNPVVPPFTINIPLEGGVKSEIINPGVPLVQINGWSDGTSDYFYGFDTDLDLRYRGGLSNEIVMYVRSPSRSYWRSHSYDFYTSVSWTQSDKTLTEIKPEVGVVYRLSPPLGSPLRRKEIGEEQRIVQSFTIVREQPNLIFAAYRPAEIYIAAEEVSIDSGDGLRLPQPLKPGFTYSVVSYRPEFNPELLRRASTQYPPEITSRYLQLPPNISSRVKNLAETLAVPYNNNYDKVMALNSHLLTEYSYNFFPPPHPVGAEVVDTFLFRDKEGICEQYATALVVMARTLGIPARLVVGYGSGDYNPITNYYEVRLNQAHSWAEVYFPGYGWVPFDPTPGWTPQPYPTPVQNWFFANNGQFLGLDRPLLRMDTLVSSGVTGLVVFVPFLIISTLLVGLVMFAIFLFKQFRLSRKASAVGPGYTSLPPDPRRRLILKIYQQGAKLLTRKKYLPRQQWQALTEYAQGVGKLPALIRLTEAAEIAAYRTEAPDEETVVKAEAALTDLQNELK